MFAILQLIQIYSHNLLKSGVEIQVPFPSRRLDHR